MSKPVDNRPVDALEFAAAVGTPELVTPIDLKANTQAAPLALFMFLFLLFGGFASALAESLSPHQRGGLAALVCVILILIFFTLRLLVRAWWEARAQRLLFNYLHQTASAPIEESLNPGTRGYRFARRLARRPIKLLRTLLRAGRLGAVVRVWRFAEGFRPPVWPIGVHFEPIHLDETNDEFDQWRMRGFGKPTRRFRGSLGSFGRRLKRVRIVSQTSPWVLALAVILLGPIGIVIAGLSLIIYGRPSQVWAFPGGIIHPQKCIIVRRTEGVLLWYAPTRTLRVMGMSGASHRFMTTPAEAELAMRAWLSPAPSPNDEMLRAFFGVE